MLWRRKGDCLDNAPMESFFHSLKTERVHHRIYGTRAEARRDLFQYIEGFYNSRRAAIRPWATSAQLSLSVWRTNPVHFFGGKIKKESRFSRTSEAFAVGQV